MVGPVAAYNSYVDPVRRNTPQSSYGVEAENQTRFRPTGFSYRDSMASMAGSPAFFPKVADTSHLSGVYLQSMHDQIERGMRTARTVPFNSFV